MIETFSFIIWIILMVFVVLITFAIGVLLLSGLVHLIAYLNKRSRRV